MNLLHLARVVDHQMRLQIDLQTPSRKANCVRFAHHVSTGEAACIWAGDTGTILFKYRKHCSNDAHRYYIILARADTSPGACDGCPMYFVMVNSWALGWSLDSLRWIKRSVCPELVMTHYVSNVYIITLLLPIIIH